MGNFQLHSQSMIALDQGNSDMQELHCINADLRMLLFEFCNMFQGSNDAILVWLKPATAKDL